MENARKLSENFNQLPENEVKSIRHKFDGIDGLRDLLLNELKSMYYVEKVLSKAFPKMIKNSCAFELIEAITIHQEDTKTQIIRLEDSFSILNENHLLQRNIAIEDLLNEIDVIVENTKFGSVRDAGIVLALHKIENYEIATYSILAIFAENLKEDKIAELLALSLNEEKIAALRLAKMATSIRFLTDHIE